MIVLAGGDVVLPDRLLGNASVVIEGAHITSVETRRRVDSQNAQVVDITGCYVVPGFVDVHVHGVEGHDTLGGTDSIAQIASRLPPYGVTAFCPTTVACPPEDLRIALDAVRRVRMSRPPQSARVLAAHIESNFINPDYAGAQPRECLRAGADDVRDGIFSARDILNVIAGFAPDVGIVTLAPELPGGLDLVRVLAGDGHRVSLGHSGANFEQALAAIEAGARHATHLFNRMTPMTHRAPGLAGAVLAREDIAAELICDGYHVHPAMARIAVAAKGVGGIMAITDGTAGSGLPPGSKAQLGKRAIRVDSHAAVLEDGTLAGSTLTMDRAFGNIVTIFRRSIVDAACLCSTTPCRELGLVGFGVIAEGAFADVVVLDSAFRVVRTFIGGEEIFCRG
jgi:N-acetylglucosamine-6-phosphate deacetylase